MNSVLPPTLSALPAVNHVTLLDAFQEAFELELDSLEWPQDTRPVLVADFPKAREGKFDTGYDVILYHLVESQIASTSNESERRPNGISELHIEPLPDKTGYKKVRFGWTEQVTVQFTVLAKSNQRANELVSWFHRTMLIYAWKLKFFKARGINYFQFVRRLEDMMIKDYGQELYSRALQYQLRLNLLETADMKTLERITLAVNAGRSMTVTD